MSKKYLTILSAATVLLGATLASCSKDEMAYSPQTDGAQTFTITVTEDGYEAQDATRASESGYTTGFSAGDACGLYIVRDGTVVNENIKMTASTTGGTLTWTLAEDIYGGISGKSFFLYYPYQSDMSGKVDASATTSDADFFATLISGWTPNSDQSSYSGYTGSDLMTSTGSASRNADGSVSLSFTMTHRMALAVIEAPKDKYIFTDTDIPDYYLDTPVTVNFSSGSKPYTIEDGMYRYIVNPAKSVTISGTYYDGIRQFTVTPDDVSGGMYKLYAIEEDFWGTRYALQAGDYFCKNSSGGWYIIPNAEGPNSDCVGVVIYGGHHANDSSNYGSTLIGQRQCHGYAVALADASTDNCVWGSTGTLGNYVTGNLSDPSTDWSGYKYTQNMISAAGGKDSLNASDASGYPAAYHAVVTYENTLSAPSGTSGWFLPSAGQLYAAVNNSGYITSAGGSGFSYWNSYWSSSETSDSPEGNAIRITVYSASATYGEKGWSYYIRPVLAF